MRRFLLAAAAAAAVLAAPLAATRSEAAPAVPAGIGSAVDTLNVVDHVQYVWGGRRYCWYPAGWKGPGWYWCGYGARRGLGWGGPVGWRGWTYRAGPAVVVRRPVVVRRGPVVVHKRVIVRRHR
jgi:hypothetical protein